VVGLALVYLLGDLDDGFHPFFEIPGEVGYHVCLFLEDKGGEEGHDFGRVVGCEDVVEDELSEDELVGRVDLAGYFPFQLHAGAVVDEVEVLEDLEALLVVGEELEVLVGHELAELRDVFFDILSFNQTGASAYLRGASVNPQRIIDSVMEDDIRLFLYGRGPATAFDLPARNMQRARDIGMGFYNDARKAYGLPTCDTFSCVTDDPVIVQILNNLYGANNVSFLDCFVGGLLEKKANSNSKLGALFSASLIDQFTRVRDGDRFWYQNPGYLTKAELTEIEATKLSDIIKRNTDSILVPADVFNRKDVTPEQVFNPPENTKWIIAIIVLSIVAAVCIIVIVGLCFAKNNNRRVDDNKLYEELNHN